MPAKKKPAYLLHQATGQARVRIGGKDHYLGAWQSPESKDRYEQLITEWLRVRDPAQLTLTIDELVLLYLDFARDYYVKGGKPTSEIHGIRAAVRPLVLLFGGDRVADFGAVKLKRVREEMLGKGWTRKTVNGHVHRIRRMFRWGVENEHVSSDLLTSLEAVTGLRRGKTSAPDRPPVKPVADSVVDATLPFLSPVVADMVRLQRLTGMRPAEVCLLRPCDVDRAGAVWVYRPPCHKTEHHGRERLIAIGPKGQEVLRPYLLRPSTTYCFSPAEAETKRRQRRTEQRVTPFTCGNKPGSNVTEVPERKSGDRYTKDSYCRAIARGCDQAFPLPDEFKVPRLPELKAKLSRDEIELRRNQAAAWRKSTGWRPNQLRHAAATEIRRRFGLEAAQVALGHAAADVTQVYAERDFAKAVEVAAAVG
jgi:integrase